MRWTTPATVALFLFMATGCATTRTVTITTDPPDAMIRIEGVDSGHGPLTQQFVFDSDSRTYRIIANRKGYKEQTFQMTPDFDRTTLQLKLKQQTRTVTLTILPVAAVVSIDGTPVSPDPIGFKEVELPFTVDAKGVWSTHSVTAERFGFEPKTIQVAWTDRDSSYVVGMDRKRKDLAITTKPPGASVYLDGQILGTTSAGGPLKDTGREFYADSDKDQWQSRKLKATKAGYDPVETLISWDNGKSDYQLDLAAKSKSIRILSDPLGAVVTLEGKELPRDNTGASFIDKLEFPPDDKGTYKTYTGIATKKTADSEWEPQPFTVGWDAGQTEYAVPMKEILTRPVPLIEAIWVHGDSGWDVSPHGRTTLAMKDTSESTKGRVPVLLTHLAKDASIDTLDVSPDGTQLLFTVLTGKDRASFRGQMMMVRTDGSGGADYVSDGHSLDLTPSFSPAGDQIAFSSDRFGRRLSICTMATIGTPGVTQVTSGDNNDLWPSIDSEPAPRLFYQAMLDTQGEPRLYEAQIGTSIRRDLTQGATQGAGGMQPRISPRDDSVVYTSVNEKTGKREVFCVSDKGGVPLDLTNAPDNDNYDPAWSKDGSKIAFVAERGSSADKAGVDTGNADIWILDVKSMDKPVQLTTNGSVDDHPVWDPSGNFIYFRSNRGGSWGIWKIGVR